METSPTTVASATAACDIEQISTFRVEWPQEQWRHHRVDDLVRLRQPQGQQGQRFHGYGWLEGTFDDTF